MDPETEPNRIFIFLFLGQGFSNSPGYPRTHYAEYTDLKLTGIHLPLPSVLELKLCPITPGFVGIVQFCFKKTLFCRPGCS